jgi:exopolysaccharide biosynthesis polyprenyl glycosylphosphotransferase
VGRPGRAFAIAIDLAALALAVAAGVWWTSATSEPMSGSALLVLVPFVGVFAMMLRGVYRERLRIVVLEDLGHGIAAVAVACLTVIVLMLAFDVNERPSPLVARVWLVASVLVVAARALLANLQHWARIRHGVSEPALIVGAGLIGQHVARRLLAHPEYGLSPVGFLDADPMDGEGLPGSAPPLLGDPDDLVDVVGRTGARHVILAFSREPDRDLLRVARCSQSLGLHLAVVPRLFDAMSYRAELEHLGALPVFGMRPVDPRGAAFAVKHALDRLLAGVTTVAVSPLLLLLAAGVRLTSPGPILFRQRRVGRDGQLFDVLKFRSMRLDGSRRSFRLAAGSAPGGVEGDDRRTTLGRFMRRSSLDELPQLLNVLKGEMSLVGPRPERPEFVSLFEEEIARYGERHRVRAGITGWAQVNGLRGQTSIADRAEWDNYYIENWSLWLDFKILVLTVLAVFRPTEEA